MTLLTSDQGKHFINGVSDPVIRGLRSIASQDPSLRVIESEKGRCRGF